MCGFQDLSSLINLNIRQWVRQKKVTPHLDFNREIFANHDSSANDNITKQKVHCIEQ